MKKHEDAIIHAKLSLKLQFKIFADTILINFYSFFSVLKKQKFGLKLLKLYDK